MKKINLIEDKSLGTNRTMFNDEVLNLKQYKVSFHDLMFNPLNTRVKDKVMTKFPDLKIDDEKVFSDEVQKVVYDALREDHSKSTNKKLISKLKSGQTEALIITENGIIISGNNRYSLLKTEIDENDEIKEKYSEIIVAVIEGELTPKEIIEWEISTQKETDIKLNYEEMNLIMRVKELYEAGSATSKMMTIMNINDEKEINRYVEMAGLYDKFLMHAGIPKRVDLHRTMPVYSYLDGLHSQLKKKTVKKDEKKILPRIYFDVILGSELPVQKFRDLIGKLVGNNGVELEDRVKLLTYTHKSLSKELEPTIEMIRQESFSEEAISKRKTLAEHEFNNLFEKVSDKIKTTIDFKKNQKKSNFNTVSKQLDKAYDVYLQIDEIKDTTIAYSYSDNDVLKLKNKLKSHGELIKNLISELEYDKD